MHSLFTPADREALSLRLAELEPATPRRWGTMAPAQMLLHCAIGLEVGTGDRPMQQVFLGKLMTPFLRGRVFGDQPFMRKVYVVKGDRDFEAERTRLATLIDRFVQRGPDRAAGAVHPFFGQLQGHEWGILMYKHLDHHLRQFGV